MTQQTSLTREQKEAVGLLSIGTFLEYFDLMLYVHMAALLNELFFPQSDPVTKHLLMSLTFCSTYFFRPIGALIFGWLGDNIGRKHTVMITTFIMSVSCIIMAVLPTYAEIGITASCVMIICRVLQGMSCMAEIIGAEIYLTETISSAAKYPAVTFLSFLAALGGTFALGVASLVTLQGGESTWRYALLVGAAVALVGNVARRTLRETPDFADARRRVKKSFEELERDPKILKQNPMWTQKINKLTAFSMFLIQCAWPVFFYLAYIHCGNILRDSFGYTAAEVIHQNFILSIVEMLGILPLVYLSTKLYPLTIIKCKLTLFFLLMLFTPYLLTNAKSPFDILVIQSFIMFFVLDVNPAIPILYKYFPVFKRFTVTAFSFAFSRALTYVVTSFGFIYLTQYYGHYGLFFIIIPIIIGFAFGILHFEKLEKKSGNYPK